MNTKIRVIPARRGARLGDFPEETWRQYIRCLESMNRLTNLKRQICEDLDVLELEVNRLRKEMVSQMRGIEESDRKTIIESMRVCPNRLWGKRRDKDRRES